MQDSFSIGQFLGILFKRRKLLILITVFFAGLSLAFAAGARSTVANLLARNELSHYRAGDRIRVDGIEGKVVEINRGGMVLSTAEGFARVPAAKFASETVIVLGSDTEEDG